MLIATPYRDFDVPKSPPKVISEIRKGYAHSAAAGFRPKITGELLVRRAGDARWWPRRAQVRSGQLHLTGSGGRAGADGGPNALRLPLRHLSLRAGPLPHSISLCRGQGVVVTLQAASERAFDEWVKTIAIELIRQTPLDSIKYLDILTIAECWRRHGDDTKKDWNFNDVAEAKPTSECETCRGREDEEPPEEPTDPREEPVGPQDVEDLLKKCQNAENYVPVKEKLFLFESLCKLDRKVRSTEDVSLKVETSTSKRARSLHDLSKINSHIAVKEICKYFENKQSEIKEPESLKSAVVPASPPLENVYKFRKIWTT